MPDAGFFARLGVFVARGFLDPETCARLRSEASSGRKVQAAVTSRREVDLETRRTQVAGVPPEVDALVADPLEAMLPEIGRHFSSRLDRHEALQFLVYEKGDFFEPHQDASAAVEGEDSPRRRRVSVVIFLNSEGDDPGPDRYGGGALTFYGLLGEAGGEEVGLPLVGEEGLLVAFRSEITHGVTPVTHGSRYTVVTWLR